MSNNFHLQLYRGTTQQNNAYTGPAGEITVDTTLSKLRLHDGSTAGGVEIGGMPTGSIIPYAGSTAPAGYLLCDGSAISRSTYSALFAIIGTTYGPGDGNSTFNLPNVIDKTFWFASTQYIGLINPGTVPNITGSIVGNRTPWSWEGSTGVFKDLGDTTMSSGIYKANFDNATNTKSSTLSFDASRVSGIYSNTSYVIPTSINLIAIIKY